MSSLEACTRVDLRVVCTPLLVLCVIAVRALAMFVLAATRLPSGILRCRLSRHASVAQMLRFVRPCAANVLWYNEVGAGYALNPKFCWSHSKCPITCRAPFSKAIDMADIYSCVFCATGSTLLTHTPLGLLLDQFAWQYSWLPSSARSAVYVTTPRSCCRRIQSPVRSCRSLFSPGASC